MKTLEAYKAGEAKRSSVVCCYGGGGSILLTIGRGSHVVVGLGSLAKPHADLAASRWLVASYSSGTANPVPVDEERSFGAEITDKVEMCSVGNRFPS